MESSWPERGAGNGTAGGNPPERPPRSHRRGHGSVIRLDFGDRPAQAEDAPQQETKLLAYRAARWLEGGTAGCTLRRHRGDFGWCREWPPRSPPRGVPCVWTPATTQRKRMQSPTRPHTTTRSRLNGVSQK